MADAEQHAEANRKFFDELAATYDAKPWQVKMQAQITKFIRSKASILGVESGEDSAVVGGKKKELRLLDYACGTGLVSAALEPYMTKSLGVDISSNMVSRFNSLISSNYGHAVVGDLLSSSPRVATSPINDPNYHGVDVAAVGLGFHHFSSPPLALERLTSRLKPGGVLLIIDFTEKGSDWAGHPHQHHHSSGPSSHHHQHHHGHGSHHGLANHPSAQKSAADPGSAESSKDADTFASKAAGTIHKNGFDEDDIHTLFSEAGLKDVRYVTMDEDVEMFFGEEAKPIRRRIFAASGARR